LGFHFCNKRKGTFTLMFMCYLQNAGQNHNLKKLKYLGTTVKINFLFMNKLRAH